IMCNALQSVLGSGPKVRSTGLINWTTGFINWTTGPISKICGYELFFGFLPIFVINNQRIFL
ncbi:13637_t:CDS:2, partial [Cetraspora pellucida]